MRRRGAVGEAAAMTDVLSPEDHHCPIPTTFRFVFRLGFRLGFRAWWRSESRLRFWLANL